MDDANIAAILAFYNLLAAKIGLEDCQSLKEVRNLMPILANYIKSGTLTFIDDPNFGFCNAIDIIAHGLDEEFHSHLRPEAAESGDLSEATKIHLAMLYTFRLLQTEAFSTICERLEDKHQRHFATVIECLDGRRCWTSAPWPKLLHTDSNEEDKENVEACERRRKSSLNFTQTPKFDSARKSFFPSGNSPILKVISSPRGEEVVRIHALQREVKALRQIRDVFGREKDKAEELCQQKERENNNLLKKVERLNSHALQPCAERTPILEDQLLMMETQAATNARQLQDAEKRAQNAEKFAADLKFELKKMDIKHDNLEKIVEEQSAKIRMSRDDSDAVEQLRKELIEAQHQNSVNASTIRELQNKLEYQEREFASRLNDKDQEKDTYWKMIDQCKARSEENTQKAYDELKKTQEEKRNLEHELEEGKRTMNELFELAEQQKEVIAACDADRTELEKAQKELDTVQKQSAERERFWKSEMERMRREIVAQEKAKSAMERQRSEAVQQMEELRTKNTKATRAHFADTNALRSKIQELEHSLKIAVNELSAKSTQVNAQQQNDMERSFRSGMNRTQSMSVTFVSRPGSAMSHQETSSNFDSAGMNDDERLKELRERNRRYPPHMRSYYLPESAHLKNSETDLNVMP
ncbi:hypothetical protein niasHT_034624 [Heterodera trifolii]|uniref:Uncharacterized protein n=1 Tax=Heterodera trifolii TaxID=157864 RepID=A0ABD2IRG5_9BILA